MCVFGKEGESHDRICVMHEGALVPFHGELCVILGKEPVYKNTPPLFSFGKRGDINLVNCVLKVARRFRKK